MRPRGTLSWISQEMLFRQFSCLFGLYLFTPPPPSLEHTCTSVNPFSLFPQFTEAELHLRRIKLMSSVSKHTMWGLWRSWGKFPLWWMWSVIYKYIYMIQCFLVFASWLYKRHNLLNRLTAQLQINWQHHSGRVTVKYTSQADSSLQRGSRRSVSHLFSSCAAGHQRISLSGRGLKHICSWDSIVSYSKGGWVTSQPPDMNGEMRYQDFQK